MRQLSISSKIRQAHANMMARCYDKSCKSYIAYGAKGVKVCKEWCDINIYRNYCLSNGWFEGCHISRNGDRGDYMPDNVRFLTPDENRQEAGDRRGRDIRCIEKNIHFKSVKEAARWIQEQGMSSGTLKTITENIRCKGLYGSTSYGYTWEVVQ